MAKLWDKGYKLDSAAEAFTVGEDYLLDRHLIKYDVLGSLAHARMLASIGILKDEELKELQAQLLQILDLDEAGKFEISPEQEDVHTAVETALVGNLRDVGKKIHTGRSRNDQILVDLRMYARDKLIQVWKETAAAAAKILAFAKRHEFVPMPGRSHTQRAMPSSVGTWAGAFAESLLDDIEILKTAYRLNDQCPLGSVAGYGTSLPINRQMTSDLLGFEKVQNNVLYAQNSRGKFEALIVFALSQITDDIARLSGDTILFSTPEFGYFSLPDEMCPGSSIMPQKKNPCPLEVARAKASRVSALASGIASTIRNLPSGYNRDVQETKGALMAAFEAALGCAAMIGRVFEGLKVNEESLKKAFSPELFAADRATELASEGMPFRDAYKKVASELETLDEKDPVENIKAKIHIGAPGALGLETVAEKIRKETEAADSAERRIETAFAQLIKGS